MPLTVTFGPGASAYDRHVGRWSRLYVPALLTAAGVAPGQRILDVATGTGEAALAAAPCVAPSGRVLGADIALPMLAVAKAKVAATPVRLVAMDGQALACRDQSFHAVLCQLGLMQFPDAARGLREFRRVLRPAGRVGVCVWSTEDRVPMYGLLKAALTRQDPAQQDVLRLQFSLADPDRLHGLLAGAGFRDVSVTRETREIAYESFEDYWEPIEAGGGRSGQVYRGLPEAARQAVREEVRERLSQFASGGRLVMEAEALIASGTR
jgi:ubiquinone/menaquinone biosynthesis C-methylase UbiE